MRRLIFRPLVLVSTFALGLFVTFLLTFAADSLSRLLYEPSETIPAFCRSYGKEESPICSQPDLYESEEAAVYSVLLYRTDIRMNSCRIVAPEVVIQDQTVQVADLPTGVAENESLEGMFEALQRDFPPADRAAFDSFLVVNDQSHPMLKHPFLVRTRSKLISHETVEAFSKTGPGSWWSAFFRKNPHASGFFTLSKVGFNPELTQALVYRAYACGDTCGYSSYVLLVKKGGAWTIVGEAWQSIS